MPKPPKAENVNNPLKRLRTILDLSQPAFATVLGVSPNTIASMEVAGRRKLKQDIFRRIACFTGAILVDNQWSFFFTGAKYTKDSYAHWRLARFDRERETHAACLRLLILLQSCVDRDFLTLIERTENFIAERRTQYDIAIKDPDFTNAGYRTGIPVNKDELQRASEDESPIGYRWERCSMYMEDDPKEDSRGFVNYAASHPEKHTKIELFDFRK